MPERLAEQPAFELLALVWAGAAIGRTLKLPNGEGIEITVRAAALELPTLEPRAKATHKAGSTQFTSKTSTEQPANGNGSMSLNKKRMVRAIGQRTRLSNRTVEHVIETLIEVWTEELVSGGRIEIEHFMVLDVQTREHAANHLLPARRFRRIKVRVSKSLRQRMNEARYVRSHAT